MIIPNIWKVKKNHVPNHQPVVCFTHNDGILPPASSPFTASSRWNPEVTNDAIKLARLQHDLANHGRFKKENYPSTIQGGAPLVPSGKLTLLLKMTIEIVDLPSYNIVIFHSYVSLPEGNKLVYKHHELGRFF